MSVEVQVATVADQPRAVIAATTTWAEFPRLWREQLDEVLGDDAVAGGREAGPRRHALQGRDLPHVEAGVEVPVAFRGAGRIVGSELPAGRVVRATLPRWEVHGHHAEGAADHVVDVYYLAEYPACFDRGMHRGPVAQALAEAAAGFSHLTP